MDDLVKAVKGGMEALTSAVQKPEGLRAAVQGIRERMAEADRLRALNRARSELEQSETRLSETIAAVGLQAVALYEAGNLASPELQALCQHVLELKRTVEEQRRALEALEAAAEAKEVTKGEVCSSCGRPLPAEGLYCSSCGALIEARLGARSCARCGAEIRAGARFCPHCGAPASP